MQNHIYIVGSTNGKVYRWLARVRKRWENKVVENWKKKLVKIRIDSRKLRMESVEDEGEIER